MATERLIVKNFGPIQEAELDLRKVTVLIGEQASGKSVLAKLVAIFSNILLNEFSFQSELEIYNIESYLMKNSRVTFECNDFSSSYMNKAIVSIQNKSLKDLVLEHERTKNAWLYGFSKPFTKRKRVGPTSGRIGGQLQPLRLAWLAVVNELISLTPQARYFPTERTSVSTLSNSLFNIIKNEVKIPEYLSVFAANFESARKEQANFSIPFLKVGYEYSDQTDKVIIENNTKIKLSDSATGFQSTIPLTVVIESLQSESTNNIFIIEEPELNLYPTTQKKLVEYLVEKCTKGDNRLIITTHSPYILTALNNCIEAANVLKSHPEAKEKVDTLVPPESQIAFEDVAAYYVANGTVRSIMNEEYQIIDANALDDVSEELSRVHGDLLDLKYQHQD